LKHMQLCNLKHGAQVGLSQLWYPISTNEKPDRLEPLWPLLSLIHRGSLPTLPTLALDVDVELSDAEAASVASSEIRPHDGTSDPDPLWRPTPFLQPLLSFSLCKFVNDSVVVALFLVAFKPFPLF